MPIEPGEEVNPEDRPETLNGEGTYYKEASDAIKKLEKGAEERNTVAVMNTLLDAVDNVTIDYAKSLSTDPNAEKFLKQLKAFSDHARTLMEDNDTEKIEDLKRKCIDDNNGDPTDNTDLKKNDLHNAEKAIRPGVKKLASHFSKVELFKDAIKNFYKNTKNADTFEDVTKELEKTITDLKNKPDYEKVDQKEKENQARNSPSSTLRTAADMLRSLLYLLATIGMLGGVAFGISYLIHYMQLHSGCFKYSKEKGKTQQKCIQTCSTAPNSCKPASQRTESDKSFSNQYCGCTQPDSTGRVPTPTKTLESNCKGEDESSNMVDAYEGIEQCKNSAADTEFIYYQYVPESLLSSLTDIASDVASGLGKTGGDFLKSLFGSAGGIAIIVFVGIVLIVTVRIVVNALNKKD